MDKKTQCDLDRIRKKYRKRCDDEGRWITIRGTHVYVGENGQLKGDIGRKIQKSSSAKKGAGKDVSGGSWEQTGVKPERNWERETLIPRKGGSSQSPAGHFHENAYGTGKDVSGGSWKKQPGTAPKANWEKETLIPRGGGAGSRSKSPDGTSHELTHGTKPEPEPELRAGQKREAGPENKWNKIGVYGEGKLTYRRPKKEKWTLIGGNGDKFQTELWNKWNGKKNRCRNISSRTWKTGRDLTHSLR